MNPWIPSWLARMMISRKTVLFCSFLLCISVCFHVGISQPRASSCSNDSVYNVNNATGKEYRNNLETLLTTLYSNATTPTGFSSSTAGTANATVYGLFLCRGDVAPNVCQDCVGKATTQVLQNCTNETRAVVWYDYCMVRFSDQTIRSRPDTDTLYQWTLGNASNVPLFNQVLSQVLDKIASLAVKSSDPVKKFAVQDANYTDSQKIYALGQCTPDISDQDCEGCLRKAISDHTACCAGHMDSRILAPSCNIRHGMYRFYNIPDSPPHPPPPAADPDPRSNQGISARVVMVIIFSIAFCITLLIVSFILWRRRSRKRYGAKRQAKPGEDDITIDPESLKYDLSEIERATNNFSPENKIGQGGFGSVYKGKLSNGQTIAVKRLLQRLGQGAAEFKNEIAVVAKLHHRNLVQLLGFCLEGEEKIIVFEFVPRRSLDYFLFGTFLYLVIYSLCPSHTSIEYSL